VSGSSFTESVVEEAVLAWQKALGYAVLHGPPSRPASPRRSAATRTIATWCWKVACARRSFGLLPDLPPEEADELRSFADAVGVKTVFLLAPTSTAARRQAAMQVATGFLYFVSVTGVTGARKALPEDLPEQLTAVRAASPVPVVVGFGVSTAAQAHELAQVADGVVVGSAIVSRLAEEGSRAARVERVKRFVKGLKRAMKR